MAMGVVSHLDRVHGGFSAKCWSLGTGRSPAIGYVPHGATGTEWRPVRRYSSRRRVELRAKGTD